MDTCIFLIGAIRYGPERPDLAPTNDIWTLNEFGDW